MRPHRDQEHPQLPFCGSPA